MMMVASAVPVAPFECTTYQGVVVELPSMTYPTLVGVTATAGCEVANGLVVYADVMSDVADGSGTSSLELSFHDVVGNGISVTLETISSSSRSMRTKASAPLLPVVLTIVNSRFESSLAVSGIVITSPLQPGSTVLISNCTFASNVTLSSQSSKYISHIYFGGDVSESMIVIQNNTFTQNVTSQGPPNVTVSTTVGFILVGWGNVSNSHFIVVGNTGICAYDIDVATSCVMMGSVSASIGEGSRLSIGADPRLSGAPNSTLSDVVLNTTAQYLPQWLTNILANGPSQLGNTLYANISGGSMATAVAILYMYDVKFTITSTSGWLAVVGSTLFAYVNGNGSAVDVALWIHDRGECNVGTMDVVGGSPIPEGVPFVSITDNSISADLTNVSGGSVSGVLRRGALEVGMGAVFAVRNLIVHTGTNSTKVSIWQVEGDLVLMRSVGYYPNSTAQSIVVELECRRAGIEYYDIPYCASCPYYRPVGGVVILLDNIVNTTATGNISALSVTGTLNATSPTIQRLSTCAAVPPFDYDSTTMSYYDNTTADHWHTPPIYAPIKLIRNQVSRGEHPPDVEQTQRWNSVVDISNVNATGGQGIWASNNTVSDYNDVSTTTSTIVILGANVEGAVLLLTSNNVSGAATTSRVFVQSTTPVVPTFACCNQAFDIATSTPVVGCATTLATLGGMYGTVPMERCVLMDLPPITTPTHSWTPTMTSNLSVSPTASSTNQSTTITPSISLNISTSATPTLVANYTATDTPSISPNRSSTATHSILKNHSRSTTPSILMNYSSTASPTTSMNITTSPTPSMSPNRSTSVTPTITNVSATPTPSNTGNVSSTVSLSRSGANTSTTSTLSISTNHTTSVTPSDSTNVSTSATPSISPNHSMTLTPTISHNSTITSTISTSVDTTLSIGRTSRTEERTVTKCAEMAKMVSGMCALLTPSNASLGVVSSCVDGRGVLGVSDYGAGLTFVVPNSVWVSSGGIVVYLTVSRSLPFIMGSEGFDIALSEGISATMRLSGVVEGRYVVVLTVSISDSQDHILHGANHWVGIPPSALPCPLGLAGLVGAGFGVPSQFGVRVVFDGSPPLFSQAAMNAVEGVAITASLVASPVAVDAQLSAALQMMDCAPAGKTTTSIRALSVVAISDTCEGLVVGNILVLVLLLLSCALVASAYMCIKNKSIVRANIQRAAAEKVPKLNWMESAGAVRCPSIVFTVALFMQSGMAVCGVQLLQGDGFGVLGGVGIGVCIGYPIVAVLLTEMLVARRCLEVVPTRWWLWVNPNAYHRLANIRSATAPFSFPLMLCKVFLTRTELDNRVPISRAFAALVANHRLQSSIWAAFPPTIPLFIALLALASGDECVPLYGVVAALYVVGAAIYFVCTPHRILAFNWFAGSALLINAALVVLASLASKRVGGDGVTEGIAILSALQMALTVVRIVHYVCAGPVRVLLTYMGKASPTPVGAVLWEVDGRVVPLGVRRRNTQFPDVEVGAMEVLLNDIGAQQDDEEDIVLKKALPESDHDEEPSPLPPGTDIHEGTHDHNRALSSPPAQSTPPPLPPIELSSSDEEERSSAPTTYPRNLLLSEEDQEMLDQLCNIRRRVETTWGSPSRRPSPNRSSKRQPSYPSSPHTLL